MNSTSLKLHLLYSMAILLLFILCYHSTIAWMFQRWGGIDSYYSHGYLIPFISAYLIWLKKHELKKLSVQYSITGLALVIFALLLHLLGTVLYIFSLSGFSMFFFIIGAVLFLFGKDVTKAISFPLVYLIFMFPLPLAVLSAISFPLKMLVAKVGVEIVKAMGIPVIRHGFDISIAAGNMVVGNPCSGLRSLIAFLALGAILAYLANTSMIRKIAIFLLAIPISILANAIRVVILILISDFYGLQAASPESIWHVGTGLMVFVIGFFLLMGVSRALRWQD